MSSLQSDEAPATGATVAAAPSSLLLVLIGIATGALAANLYYAQPLIAGIAPEIGIRPDLAGAVVSVTQIGYAAGLFFLVSLADLVESRRLVLTYMAVTIVALIAVAMSRNATVFFLASFLVGAGSTAAQVLVPFSTHLVPEASRGRTVGNIMAGLLTGILLARPASLFIAAALGWRAVFWASAVLMLVIAAALIRMMPRYTPRGGLHYGQILASMVGIFRKTPVLRRRAAYQALMFAAFNVFWTAAPIMLAQRFGLSQAEIAVFALAGAGGALAAPIAGRLADRGHIWSATFGGIGALTLCFVATGWIVAAGVLWALVILTVIIDAAVQFNQVVSQRVIFALAPELRGRINAIYMTISFIGGAIGSLVATATYHWGGWSGSAMAGGIIGIAGLALFATERRKPRS
jgi:predicted MFS family arabinose efflux permease